MSSSQDALEIWNVGVAAVDSSRLIHAAVRRQGSILDVCGERINLHAIGRLIIVGAGKAGAGMARGLEETIGNRWLDEKVTGWINIPADCVQSLRRIKLHAARPAGVNEPTAAGIYGTEQILKIVSSMKANDVCLVLLSGGGSALLPLPIEGIRWEDKQIVTRSLSRSGATIQEMNVVRTCLSRIKGGGLVRAAPAGRMLALIISDVIGDPLDVIASGPTTPHQGTATEALTVLERMNAADKSRDLADLGSEIPQSVWNVLHSQAARTELRKTSRVTCQNFIIGNNQTAVDAAIEHARRLRYEVRSLGTGRGGFARDVGIELAEACLEARRNSDLKSYCFVGGGEPVVRLTATDLPRRGGRNQEVALSACCRLWAEDMRGIAVLSGGTDGEDGPTDAAGAVCDEVVQQTAHQRGLDPLKYLSINDSYTFFDQSGGLIKTGPTHTNVMDLQIGIVRPLISPAD